MGPSRALKGPLRALKGPLRALKGHFLPFGRDVKNDLPTNLQTNQETITIVFFCLKIMFEQIADCYLRQDDDPKTWTL